MGFKLIHVLKTELKDATYVWAPCTVNLGFFFHFLTHVPVLVELTWLLGATCLNKVLIEVLCKKPAPRGCVFKF